MPHDDHSISTGEYTTPVNLVLRPPPANLALGKEGEVRTAPLLGIPRLLAGFGVDADAVLAEADFDQAWFGDGENWLAVTIGLRTTVARPGDSATHTRCRNGSLA